MCLLYYGMDLQIQWEHYIDLHSLLFFIDHDFYCYAMLHKYCQNNTSVFLLMPEWKTNSSHKLG